MKNAFLHPLSEYQALDGKELESFYDHNWATEFFGEYGDGPLNDACFSLCASLKSAAIVHSYPVLIARLVKAGIGGALDQSAREIGRNLDRFASLLTVEIGPTTEQLSKIEDALGQVKLALAEATRNQANANEDEIWNSVCNSKNHTLVVATTGALRLVFTGQFAAFESFCQDCCGLVDNGQKSMMYRYRGKNNTGTLEDTFDSVLYDKVLGGHIENARLVRNALVHRSGLVPPAMKVMNHGFQTSPDEFVIVPEDNRKLFKEIKSRSLTLASETLRKVPSIRQ